MAVGKQDDHRASRYSRVGASKVKANAATWEDAEQETLWRAIQEVTNQGGALMFGLTRDGGACVLTVMDGDERIKQYATGPDEVAELLREVREAAQRE